MQIQTSRFGLLDIDDQSIISIPGGLIGFPRHEQYVIIRHKPESPFYWFQATDREDLAFALVDPLLFKPDYQVPLSKPLMSELQADKPEDLGIFVIITIPPGRPEAMTANLLGPLIINIQKRLARQVVLDEQQYSHRHPIMSDRPPRPDSARTSD